MGERQSCSHCTTLDRTPGRVVPGPERGLGTWSVLAVIGMVAAADRVATLLRRGG